jgi:hypothetical protein
VFVLPGVCFCQKRISRSSAARGCEGEVSNGVFRVSDRSNEGGVRDGVH